MSFVYLALNLSSLVVPQRIISRQPGDLSGQDMGSFQHVMIT